MHAFDDETLLFPLVPYIVLLLFLSRPFIKTASCSTGNVDVPTPAQTEKRQERNKDFTAAALVREQETREEKKKRRIPSSSQNTTTRKRVSSVETP